MCGILGCFHRTPTYERVITQRAVQNLNHRGPDSSGTHHGDYIELGHTRLSIVDLTSGGRQPMMTPDNRFIITFNGEIYNHVELRMELENLGENFQSHSDTEVLLLAYKNWGRDCVSRLRGMFALAIWDSRNKTLFLARDRCGEKPIFFFRNDDGFFFASELKGLIPLLPHRPDLNPEVIDMYLHYQYVPEPQTLLNQVWKLPAAHTMLISIENWDANPVRYWDVETCGLNLSIETENPSEIIRQSLEEAVQLTLRSDVPVGIALSAGIDSGAIAALAARHYPSSMHAFCVGYPGRPEYDERSQARALAESLGMTVHEIELPVNDFVNFFPTMVSILDEPIADPAAFGHYAIPKAAAERGIKVLLSGLGGDEIFWGYPWVTRAARTGKFFANHASMRSLLYSLRFAPVSKFLGLLSANRFMSAKIRSRVEAMLKMIENKTPHDQLHFYMSSPDFSMAFGFKKMIYGDAMAQIADANAFRPTQIGHRNADDIPAAIIRLLFDTWLVSNCLSLGDRVSMAASVETRLPFLDFRLIETSMALRAKNPDQDMGQKFLLREALRGVLPEAIRSRPKSGFQPPVHEWLSGVVQRYGDYLFDGMLVKSGVVSSNQLDFILQALPKRNAEGLFFAYKLVLLEMWYRTVVLGESCAA
jgi:asparagine synthase (glutamine-hydrolysing)